MASSSSSFSTLRFFEIFSARLVLQVFGGGGAIWGFAECVTWRRTETQEAWRGVTELGATLFAMRFLLQMVDFYWATPQRRDEKNLVRLIQVFSAKLILEVWGATGAIWGFSETLTLRNDDTVGFWRSAALLVGIIFFGRYLLQALDFIKQINVKAPSVATIGRRIRFVQIFSARLVLDVFGGGGAIWGFSEAMRFRTEETQEFWRMASIFSAFIFAIRYMLQMQDYLRGQKVERITIPSPRNMVEFQETEAFTEDVSPAKSTDYGTEEISPSKLKDFGRQLDFSFIDVITPTYSDDQDELTPIKSPALERRSLDSLNDSMESAEELYRHLAPSFSDEREELAPITLTSPSSGLDRRSRDELHESMENADQLFRHLAAPIFSDDRDDNLSPRNSSSQMDLRSREDLHSSMEDADESFHRYLVPLYHDKRVPTKAATVDLHDDDDDESPMMMIV